MDFNTSLATQSYAQARAAVPPEAGGSGPGSLFEQAASSFVDAVKAGEDTAKAAMAGQADPHALVQALAQTELAIETAVTVRNKVVEAYQEILRMPV
ncbi:flagellar hook-basal body protein FliE [Thioclava sediminum]|uniref:Flagellar hook-basal body protein FliE n=1 Tax=Thioclava sediminum TaxID=1915319 RepID=A0ABX3MX51_9RHOB|nr:MULTISPECIES: flagellar hook-basal body complex protein FliE [Thioclava]OOY23105.1 flagellar hook-basal body protein FliE [Thioclava sediminum]PFG61601.1 flagellar hook-basal body complex protein FliE [Thioclava sp. ES.031]